MHKVWTRSIDDIRHLCEFANPEVEKTARLLRNGTIRWAPKVEPVIRMHKQHGPRWLVPFGAAPLPAPELPVPDMGLRPYQVEAFEALIPHDCGVVVAPCGAGKTQVGCALLKAIGGGLVVVHTTDLAAQWAERCAALGIPATVRTGVRAFDAHDGGGVVISTVQTLSRVQAHPWEWPVVIVDEAHHAPAKTYTELMPRLQWRRIYGLTATPERADGMTPAMYAWLGPLRYGVQRQELVAAGNTIIPRVIRVLTGSFTMSSEFTEMVNELTSNERRNLAICGLVSRHGARPQLVLTSRVEHAEMLAQQLTACGMSARALTGQTKDRETALEAVRAGLLDVIVATQLADEGLDVPTLTAVHMVAPARAAARVEQRVGRIMRPAPGKVQPVIYDYVDNDSLMQSQWRSRAKVYRMLGVTRFETLHIG